MVTLKLIACLVSIVALGLYYNNYRQIPEEMVLVEQKLTLWLSVTLVMYNDPFYWLVVYSPNLLSVLFTAISNNFFNYSLVYFWLVLFERIQKENAQKSTAADQFWKKLLLAFMIVVSVLADTLQGMMFATDPGFQIEEEYTWIWVFDSWVVFGVIALSYLYILSNVYKGMLKWKQLLGRHQVIFNFSLLFMAAQFVYICFEENHINFEVPKLALVIVTISNIYVIAAQYFYSLAPEGFEGNLFLISLIQF